ncbi:hypothetical protein HDU67_010347 [Dinochytrium kinnereticum]|nr:hypothetical protein HDU67_010347 [Dinochytrium kinnereticum]
MAPSPSVKRLMKEFADLQADPSPEFTAAPLEDNIFECIMFMTPNGRFETNKKICLSITNHHPESWRPSWGVRSALTALISFFPTPGSGAIAALDYTEEERKVLAKRSLDWRCDKCGGGGKEGLEDSGGESKKLAEDEEISFSVRKEDSSTESLDKVSEVEAVAVPQPQLPQLDAVLRQRVPVAAPDALAAEERPVPNNHQQNAVIDPQSLNANEARKKQIDTMILIIFAVLSYIVIRRVSIVYTALATPSF